MQEEVAKVEALVRSIVPPEELAMIVSNIGATPDFSAIYTTNSAMHTAFVQVSLNDGAHDGQLRLYGPRGSGPGSRRCLQLTAYFQSGGLVDAVLNLGLAGADRCAGCGFQHGEGVRHGAGAGRQDPRSARRG